MKGEGEMEEDTLFEENVEEENQQSEWSHKDRFSDFMFGPGRKQQLEANEHEHQERYTNHAYIDYEQLMVNFDALMESVQNLKPLFQKFKPFVEQIWKKK